MESQEVQVNQVFQERLESLVLEAQLVLQAMLVHLVQLVRLDLRVAKDPMVILALLEFQVVEAIQE